MNRRRRLAQIRRSAKALGLTPDVPDASEPEIDPDDGGPAADLDVEVRSWTQEATNAGFRSRVSPLAPFLGQKGRW